MELPLAICGLSVLLVIAWWSPTSIAFLFLLACAAGAYAMVTALLARHDAER